MAPDLTPGTYTVRCAATGFKPTSARTSLCRRRPGCSRRLSVDPWPGHTDRSSDRVLLQLDTSSAVVSGTLNTEAIVDLPLKARNYQDFLALRPGVCKHRAAVR